jgi:hypothetical protein
MNEVSTDQYQRLNTIVHNIFKRLRQLQGDIDTMFPQGITSTELSVLQVVEKNRTRF